MVDDRLQKTIEVRDKGVAEELFWHLEEGLRKRGAQLIRFDPLVDDFFGSKNADDAETRVRYAIERADFSRNSVKASIQLRTAQSIADRLLEWIRRPLHELVVFYVGLMAEKQKVFNSHAISAIRLTLEIVQRQSREARSQEIAELKAEIERLREQIGRLEDTIEHLALDEERARHR